jgi:3-deoxy-D-manno-octulosonic-acid transferase
MSVPLILRLYNLATAALAMAMPLWLRRRVASGKESPTRWRERYGETTLSHPGRPLIWCHAASVGETASIMPLIKVLAAQGHAVVLTTGTVSSEQLVRDQLPLGVVHQFAPLDYHPWLSRFLDHWRPHLALRVDSELWPNTILMLRERGIPIIQINARISQAAAGRWSKAPAFAQALFSCFDLVLAQSEDDRARYAKCGAPQTAARGNLKLAQPALPYDSHELATLKEALGGRPVWLAASIHPGEDEVVGAAHRDVKNQQPNTLLVVVPRHPARAAEMATTLQNLGFTVAQRSTGQPIKPGVDIYLADTMGELGLFYRLAPVVFIGKTFTVGGGQNPVEAVQLGCALVWGPDMSNFTEIAADLCAQGAALAVAAPEKLGETISDLLADGPRVSKMAAAGQSYVDASSGALARVLDDLAPYLTRAAIR